MKTPSTPAGKMQVILVEITDEALCGGAPVAKELSAKEPSAKDVLTEGECYGDDEEEADEATGCEIEVRVFEG